MLNGSGVANGSVGHPTAAPYHIPQQFSEANHRLFQPNSFHPGGVVGPFSEHIAAAAAVAAATAHNSVLQQQAARSDQQHGAGVMPSHAQLSQLPLSTTPQSFAAALFASSPLISDDLKLAAAAAAAAAQSARGKKSHRAEPVPQSGFKGVSWNSRMKAWLAFYVTENGERKSKTFSTRKLGMEEARLQAITFCKQKQDQRRERKRTRELHGQHCGGTLQNNDAAKMGQGTPIGGPGTPSSPSSSHQAMLRCGYPTTPGLTNPHSTHTPPTTTDLLGHNHFGSPTRSSSPTLVLPTPSTSSSEIAYVPIVPIAVHMIEKSGLLQPLELNELPPCQHCTKQPYPFLMIVSEGQEQTYSGTSIMSLASHNGPPTGSGGQLETPGHHPHHHHRTSCITITSPLPRRSEQSLELHPSTHRTDESSRQRRDNALKVSNEGCPSVMELVETGCANDNKQPTSQRPRSPSGHRSCGGMMSTVGCQHGVGIPHVDSVDDAVHPTECRRQETSSRDHRHAAGDHQQRDVLHDAAGRCRTSSFPALSIAEESSESLQPSQHPPLTSNKYRDELEDRQQSSSVVPSNASNCLSPSALQLAMNLHCNMGTMNSHPNVSGIQQSPFLLHHASPAELNMMNHVNLFHHHHASHHHHAPRHHHPQQQQQQLPGTANISRNEVDPTRE